MQKKHKSLSQYHDKIVELAKSYTSAEICRELGVASSSLNYYMQKHQISAVYKKKNLSDYDSQIRLLASEGKNAREISIDLGLESTSVLYHCKTSGISVRNGKFTIENKQQESEVIALHKDGFTYEEIAKQLEIPSKRIPKILDKYGEEKRTTLESYRINYTINDKAFTDFEDAETVYWYGWLLTDGCITDKNSISLSLKAEDGYIVERFRDYMKSNAKINYSNYFHKQLQRNVKQVGFSVMSKLVVDSLKLQNMEPRKSCKERLPNFDWLDGSNATVFWRAVLEGDGYVSNFENRNPEISLVGSEELLNGFKKFVVKHCGVDEDRELKKRNYGDPNFRLVTYSGVNALKIMRKLWKDCGILCLERKRLRAVGNLEKFAHRLTN